MKRLLLLVAIISGLGVAGATGNWFGTAHGGSLGGIPEIVTAAMAVIAFVWAIVDAARREPQVRVSFDQGRDVTMQKDGQGVRGRWMRLSIQNARGRKSARNARVYLVGLDRRHNTGLEPMFFDSRALIWTHSEETDPAGIDLLPGVPHRVDLVTSYENSTVLRLWTGIQAALPTLKIGEHYRLTLQVSAEETTAKQVHLEISCPGDWSQLTGFLEVRKRPRFGP